MQPDVVRWAERIRPVWDAEGDRPMPVHRKIWEWAYITQALFERGMLQPGKRGLGFGVGRDPLAALFASFGCEIVATDLEVDEAARVGWVSTGQHASSIDHLNEHRLCEPSEFRRLVTFETADMRDIPKTLRGFDFNWSACCFEHLGSIDAGAEFMLRQMDTLKVGGVGVHTTEYNVSSNDETVFEGGTVLFRRRDIESIVSSLRDAGGEIDVGFDVGDTPADQHVDRPPFTTTHLKLEIDRYVATSVGLIVEKVREVSPPRPRRTWRSLARRALGRR